MQFIYDFYFYSAGTSPLSHQAQYLTIQSKVQILEARTKEAERAAELAEADAREKDKELVETLKRLKDYESVCIFTLSVKEFGSILTITDCSGPFTVYRSKAFHMFIIRRVIPVDLH